MAGTNRLLLAVLPCVCSVGFLLASYEAIAQGPLGVAPQPGGPTNPSTSTMPGRPADPAASQRTNSPVPRSTARNTYVRLARAPNMFGDTLRPLASLRVTPNLAPNTSADLALAGASNFNAAENNRALPTDRVFFGYNGFFNAVDMITPNGAQSSDIHMYKIGFEKTLLDGQWSVEARMPLLSSLAMNSQVLSTDAGNVGNLSIFAKRLLIADDSNAIAAGLGFGLPTGQDLIVQTGQNQLRFTNEALHLMPFVAWTIVPMDELFFNAFGQIDFAASGTDVVSPLGVQGTFNNQHLMHLDASLGRWLISNTGRRYLTGVAGLLELHYTSTLQDSDVLNATQAGLPGFIVVAGNRRDLLNLTSGLHFQLGPASNLRIGAVTPLRSAPDRAFDTEIQVVLNRVF